MAKLIFEGLTYEQALEFASWYGGRDEQDADIWFDINGVETPYVDNFKPIVKDEANQTVTVRLKKVTK